MCGRVQIYHVGAKVRSILVECADDGVQQVTLVRWPHGGYYC